MVERGGGLRTRLLAFWWLGGGEVEVGEVEVGSE